MIKAVNVITTHCAINLSAKLQTDRYSTVSHDDGVTQSRSHVEGIIWLLGLFIHQNVSVDTRTEVQSSTLTSYFVMSKQGLTDLMSLFRLHMQSTNLV